MAVIKKVVMGAMKRGLPFFVSTLFVLKENAGMNRGVFPDA